MLFSLESCILENVGCLMFFLFLLQIVSCLNCSVFGSWAVFSGDGGYCGVAQICPGAFGCY